MGAMSLGSKRQRTEGSERSYKRGSYEYLAHIPGVVLSQEWSQETCHRRFAPSLVQGPMRRNLIA